MTLLRAIVLTAIIATVTASAQPLTFEVASVKANTGTDLSIPFGPTPPDGITMINRPLESIIRYAYGFESFRITGMPPWATAERFDISARAVRAISESERQSMLRSLLADRFHLRTNRAITVQTVYVLTRLPDRPLGAGLQPRPDCTESKKCEGGGSAFRGGRLTLRAARLDTLAGMMSSLLGATVRNETNIDGSFDVEMSWRPDVAAGVTIDPNDARPSFQTAVQEQLGLKLDNARRQVDILVIEALDRPTPD